MDLDDELAEVLVLGTQVGANLDGLGPVFRTSRGYLRLLSDEGRLRIAMLQSNGVLDELVLNKLVPELEYVKSRREPQILLGVLTQELSSPAIAEWPFEMLVDAARLHMRVLLHLQKYGYTLLDAHFENVKFTDSGPVFLDLGSLMPTSTAAWPASVQYRAEIRLVLVLMLRGYWKIVRAALEDSGSLRERELWAMRHPIVGRILNLAHLESRVKVMRHRLRIIGVVKIGGAMLSIASFPRAVIQQELALRTHLNQHVAKLLAPFAQVAARAVSNLIGINPNRELRRLERMSEAVRVSYWSSYYTGRGVESLSPRLSRVLDYLSECSIASNVDVGGNTGIFSEAGLRRGVFQKAISLDSDEHAADVGYRNARSSGLPIEFRVVDIAARFRRPAGLAGLPVGECATALAITHHLVLICGLSFEEVCRGILACTSRFAAIEFMPLGLWNGRSAPPLPEWYSEEAFRQALLQVAVILKRDELEDNRVLFFVERFTPESC